MENCWSGCKLRVAKDLGVNSEECVQTGLTFSGKFHAARISSKTRWQNPHYLAGFRLALVQADSAMTNRAYPVLVASTIMNL